MTGVYIQLSKMGFVKTHSIVAGNPPEFVPEGETRNEEPSVYVWVATKDGEKDAVVLYVGKAGKGVDKRCGEHKNGFKNSKAGQANAAALLKYLGNGYQVSVYERVSQHTEMFGQTVPMHSTEEEALILLLDPVINKK